VKIACEVPWQNRRFRVPLGRITRCEQLGFDAVVTAEGAGSDALTPLAYIAAHTSKIGLGTTWRH
jgi:alkanesulfonate monooxygenase SsuD/methylene tetrahydromethanopterin reductase-like flavin-dependent oxidoreductase (luciferase family)